MATGKALDGKPYAGNPHVRFDEGEVAPAAKPRRGSLLYKKTLCPLLIAAVFTAMGAEKKTDSFKVHFIEKARSAPVIDGKFDDECWKGVEGITDWGPCTFLRRKPAVMPETYIKYLWDDKYLYVAIRCDEDHIEENMALFRKNDYNRAQPVYNRDCVELHIDGNNDRHTKFQCWFAPTEERMIFWNYDFGWGILTDNDYGLNADWHYKCSVDEKGWQIEARLALAHFEMKGRPGNICAIEPCRFRMMKRMKGLDGKDLGVTTRLWGWASQGRDHSDVRIYGKCIFVEKKPKDLVEGLRLAYPDLDEREFYVQTTKDYIVVSKGKVTKVSYIDKARELLDGVQKLFDRTDALVKEPAYPGAYNFTTNSIARHRAAFEEVKGKLAGRDSCDIALLSEITEGAKKWANSVDEGYWRTVGAIMRNEKGKVRHRVELAYDPALPELSDEEARFPEPWRHNYPRVEWAKNLAVKSPKTLVFVSSYAAIDAWNLKNRLGIDADIFWIQPSPPSDGEDYWHEGLYTTAFVQKILENKLARNDYGAFVFLGLTPKYMTQRLQCWFLERLYAGAKIVFVNNGWDHWGFNSGMKKFRHLQDGFVKDMPALGTYGEDEPGFNLFKNKPYIYNLPFFERGEFGKGSLTVFNPGQGQSYMTQQTLSPSLWCYPSYAFNDEYCIAATVRVVMEGLGLRGPRTAVSVSVGEGAAAAEKKFDAALAVDGPEAWRGTVRYLVRDNWGKVVQKAADIPASLPAGRMHVTLGVKPLPAGRYTIDAWLLEGGGVLDFVSCAVNVADKTGSLCACNPLCRSVMPSASFESVKLAKPCFELTEKIVAVAKVLNPVKGMEVEASVRDPRRRIVERRRFPVCVSNAVARIEFAQTRLDYPCNFLETRLVLGSKVLAEGAEMEFYRHDTRHDDYEIFADPCYFGGQQADLRDAFMQHFGVSLYQSWVAPTAFRGGYPVFRHWISGRRSDLGGSMSTRAYTRRLKETYRREAQALRNINGHFLSLGDDSGDSREFFKTSPDWLPTFLERLRARFEREIVRDPKKKLTGVLRDWYKTREIKLNGGGNWRWGAEVPLDRGGYKLVLKGKLTGEDVSDLVASFRDAYPTIEKFNRHHRVNFRSFNEITAANMSTLDPVDMPEFLNFQFYLRDRYKDIAKLNALWKSDWKDFFDVKDSFIDEQKFKKNFAPAIDRAIYLEDNFIAQFKAIADAVKSVDPTMGVGLCASGLGNAMPDVLEHLNTVGPYLGGEEIEFARCMPHVYLGETIGVYGGRNIPARMREREVYHGLFSGANFSWFWATCYALKGDMSALPERSRRQLETYREVTRGIAALVNRSKRENDSVRVLISRTAGRIEPLLPGHCTHAQARVSFTRVIEDLGLQFDYITTKQVERGDLVSSKAKVLILGSVQTFTAKELRRIEEFVKAGGKVIADVTPGIADNYGRILEKPMLDAKNYTLIPFKPVTYTFLRGRGELGTMREDALKLFASCGVKPLYRTLNAKGEEVTNVEYSRFTRGDVTYLGYEKIANTFETFPMKATLELGGKFWVSEVRSGRNFGFVDKVELDLTGLDCLLFALKKAEPSDVVLEAPSSVARGAALEVRAESNAQVLRFEMIAPDGYSEERYAPFRAKILDVKDGVASHTFPIAWNEPYDSYTLVVTDVASGKSAKKTIKVK